MTVEKLITNYMGNVYPAEIRPGWDGVWGLKFKTLRVFFIRKTWRSVELRSLPNPSTQQKQKLKTC